MAAVLFTLPLLGAITVGDVLAVGAAVLSILLAPKPKEPTFKSMTSAWGNCIPVVYNSFRVAGNVIQAGPVTKHDNKSKKGGPAYSQTIAVSVCEGVRSIGRIWADKQVIYDPRPLANPQRWQPDTDYGAGDYVWPTSGTFGTQFIATIAFTSGATEPTWDFALDAFVKDGEGGWVATPYTARTKIGQQYNFTMRIYTGTETQLPDAALEELVGTGNQPGYRGLVYVVFENWDLSKYGNRIPNLEFEVLGDASNKFVNDGVYYGHGSDTPGDTGQFLQSDCGGVFYVRGGQLIELATGLPSITLDSTRQTADAAAFGWPHGSFDGKTLPVAGKYFITLLQSGSYGILLYEINCDGSATCIGCREYTGVGVDMSGGLYTGLSSNNGCLYVMGLDFANANINVAFFGTIADMTGAYALDIAGPRGRYISETTGLYAMVPRPYLNGFNISFVGDHIYIALNKSHMNCDIGVGSNTYYVSLRTLFPDGVLIKITLFNDGIGSLTYSFEGISEDFGWPFSDEGLDIDGAPGNTSGTPLSATTWDDWGGPGQVQDTDGTILSLTFVRGYSGVANQNLAGVKQFGFFLNPMDPLAPGIWQETGQISGAPFGNYVGAISGARAYQVGPSIYMHFDTETNQYGYAKIGGFIPAQLTLADIVADVSQRVGLSSGDYDYTQLEAVIPRGVAILSRDAARAFIEAMQPAYFFDLVDVGANLLGTLRVNDALVQTIPEEDLAAAPTAAQVVDRISSMRNDDKEIPQDLAMSYYDFNHDYEQNSQPARRNRVTQYSSGRNTVTVPCVMTAGEAATAALRSLLITWLERTPRKFSIPPEYLPRTPGDIVAAQRGGENYFVRLSKVTLQPTWVIECESVSEDLGVYTVQVPASLSDLGTGAYTPGTINPPAPPVLAIVDTAPLRPDDVNSVGVYVGGSGNQYGARFDFENVNKSTDDMSFAFQQQLTAEATMGFATSVLGDCLRWTVFDKTNFVDVQLYNGVLSNASKANLIYSRANVLWMGNGEIIQYMQADLIDTVNKVYRLSGLLRGRFGTEAFTGTHALNELAVVPVAGPIQNQPYDTYEIGSTRYWKGSNDSPTTFETPVQTLTMTTRRLMPFAPFFIRGSRDGSDNLTITGIRRVRWHGTPLWHPPETDNPVAMQVDILNGSAVARTLTSALSGNGSGIIDPSGFEAYYSAADQILDFGSVQASIQTQSYEMNAVVGRGYGRAKTL